MQTKKQLGYTLAEALVVLAITGIVLGTTMVTFNAWQRSERFQSGVDSFILDANTTMNNLRKGTSPGPYRNYKCVQDSSGLKYYLVSDQKIGESAECTIIGIAFQLAPGGDRDKYTIHTLIAPETDDLQSGLDHVDFETLHGTSSNIDCTNTGSHEYHPDPAKSCPPLPLPTFEGKQERIFKHGVSVAKTGSDFNAFYLKKVDPTDPDPSCHTPGKSSFLGGFAIVYSSYGITQSTHFGDSTSPSGNRRLRISGFRHLSINPFGTSSLASLETLGHDALMGNFGSSRSSSPLSFSCYANEIRVCLHGNNRKALVIIDNSGARQASTETLC